MKQPTILDVAERAGVSKSLVSLVMREPDRVSDAGRATVLAAAAELGYRPNAVARSLVQRRTNVIGVIVADLHNPFYADVADGIEEEASRSGYRAMLSSGFRDPKREGGAIETMLELRVDGLILLGSMAKLSSIEEVAASIPVTLLGRQTRSKVVDSVAVDNSAGAQAAIDYLVAQGHTRITHIHAGTAAGSRRRRSGYEKAMRRHGLAKNIRLVEGAFTEAAGARAMSEILAGEETPTAVFAPNDIAAIGALETIDRAGLAVPGDISLVGYDNLALAALPRISLTTVGQPRADLGRQAVNLVLERLDEGRKSARHLVVPPDLVIRSTTGPPSGGGPQPSALD